MKAMWSDVEDELLERVFYAHEDTVVRDSENLAQAGMLDSLSIVAILDILVEMTGNEDAMMRAGSSDFRSLASIHAFYQSL
ncbi:MAG TPA: hypothetical protein PLT68_00255 [Actinomycetota bacterium]|nr:hypothetical protein [Actinomycetota bacterium]